MNNTHFKVAIIASLLAGGLIALLVRHYEEEYWSSNNNEVVTETRTTESASDGLHKAPSYSEGDLRSDQVPIERVKFKKGTSYGLLSVDLSKNKKRKYLLWASKGQKMIVSNIGVSYYKVYDSKGGIIKGEFVSEGTNSYHIPYSGDNVIVIDGRDKIFYSIKVEIPPR